MIASDVPGEEPPPQQLVIKGYNMHQCLRLFFVPEEIKCLAENIKQMMEESIKVMGLGGSASYPRIVTNSTTEKSRAEFLNARVLKPGLWKVCLAQFVEAQGDAKTLILGAEPVGTLKAKSSKPKTKSK